MSISWLLFKKSGKQSIGRLGLTTAAIALGIVMILCFVTTVNALISRGSHSAWRYNAMDETSRAPVDGIAPLKMMSHTNGSLNKWQNQTIWTTSVAATGTTSPAISDIKTPGPGEYYMSEALAKVAKENPDADIGARFGTKYLGTLPRALDDSPDALSVIRGFTGEELAQLKPEDAVDVYTMQSSDKLVSTSDPITNTVLLFGAAMLLFPIVMFISIATQLGSAQREKRYAAMRLVGASRSQITRILMFESLLASIAGVVIGSLVYVILRIPMTNIRFNDMRFWADDLVVHPGQYMLIVGLTLLLSIAANWWGMRRVQTSPLGVVRSQKINKKPRSWRLLPLIAGIGVFVWINLPFGNEWMQKYIAESPAPMLVMIGGIMLIMIGLVLSGAWMTSIASRIIAYFTKNAVTLVATKRIAGHSKQVFRSVSGVVLALFAGSFYLTAVSGVDKLSADTLARSGYAQIKPEAAAIFSSSSTNFGNELRKQSYVQSSAEIYRTENGHVIRCDALAQYTKRSCGADMAASDYVLLSFEAAPTDNLNAVKNFDTTAPKDYIVMLADNSDIDKLRSFVVSQIGLMSPQAYVVSGTYAQIPAINPITKELAGLAYIGMGVTLLIAIASLIVSTIGGLLERKRSLFTLRLGGMTVAQMKRAVMIESLIPLIVVSLAASGVGVWIGFVFITTLSRSLHPELSLLYFAIVIGSLVIAAIGIYLILPMIRSLTSLESNQTE